MKQLALYFHTSSKIKVAHLRYLLGLHRIEFQQASTFKGYPELQVETARESQRAGAEYLRSQYGGPFFIEDTEVWIEAYSLGKKINYPGFDIKRWWQVTTFEEIDAKCRQVGTREASQTSNICLSIPGLPLFFFRSTVKGHIVEDHVCGCDNPDAPWLSAREFGSIFVPEGAEKPFVFLPLEESLKFDFRKRAADKLAKKIKEINAILNLDQFCYTNRGVDASVGQLSLFTADDLLSLSNG